MKDFIVKFCIFAFNLMSVVLIAIQKSPPVTVGERVLRAFLVSVYLVTIVILMKGDRDEDNNEPSDDV